MNPFILAALVFGAIGLIQEAIAINEDPKKSKVSTPAVEKKAGDTIVNIGGQKVQTAAQKAAEVEKKNKDKTKDKTKEPAPSDG